MSCFPKEYIQRYVNFRACFRHVLPLLHLQTITIGVFLIETINFNKPLNPRFFEKNYLFFRTMTVSI